MPENNINQPQAYDGVKPQLRTVDAFSSRPVKRRVRIMNRAPGECDMLLVVLDTPTHVNPSQAKRPLNAG